MMKDLKTLQAFSNILSMNFILSVLLLCHVTIGNNTIGGSAVRCQSFTCDDGVTCAIECDGNPECSNAEDENPDICSKLNPFIFILEFIIFNFVKLT